LRFSPAASLVRRLRDESGAALVMGLGILMTMTVMLTGTLEMTASGPRDAALDNADQNAYALAEAGMNNALSVLEANYPGTVQYPGNPNLLPQRTTQLSNGSVTWGGTLQKVTGKPWAWQWSLVATGQVLNPTGPATHPATRQVKAVVPVALPKTELVGDTSILNWIYAFKDATFSNQVAIGSPLYAGGNLTLDNKATVTAGAHKLVVGGVLTMRQNADGVGSSASRIGQTYVVGGCSWLGSGLTLHNPCQWDTDNVWANPTYRGSTIPTTDPTYTGPAPAPGFITLPTLTCCSLGSATVPPSTMGFWYINASPGPGSPCDAASKTGTPPTFDTGDNLINNSATPSTPYNLTPSNASYTCRTTDGDGHPIGELSWNATTKILTISGTVFIDGSAAIDNSGYSGQPVFQYKGQGTIYLSGTFAIKQTKICAVISGSDCDWTTGHWNPNDPTQGALVVIANGDGGAGGAQSQGNVVKPGDGIVMVGGSFQGALLANKSIELVTTPVEQGPMVSVYNSVSSGQTGTLSFPSVNIQPAGAAGVTAPIPLPTLLTPQQFG